MNPARECHASDDAVWRREADEVFLLHAGNGACLGLDDVGGRIWELLIETGEVQETVSRLAAEFGASQETVRPDVERLAADLVRRGFLRASAH
jgi:hypothetical protein